MAIVDFIGLHTSFVLMCILTLWFGASAIVNYVSPARYEKNQIIINALAIAAYLIFFCVHNFFHPASALTYMQGGIFFLVMAMLFECLTTTIEPLKKIKIFLIIPSLIFIGLYLYRTLNPYMHTYTKFYLSHLSLIFAVFILLTVFIITTLISSKIAQQSVKNLKKYIK